MADVQNDDQFTVEKFLDLLGKSNAAALLPAELRLIMDNAIAKQDLATLQKLYDILQQEKTTESNIAKGFSEAKEKIMDRFMVTATEIRKKYAEAPMKAQIAATVVEEEAIAEQILTKI